MVQTKLLARNLIVVFCALCFFQEASAEEPPTLKVGFIGSLTSFAANYGQAVLEGVTLAKEELAESEPRIELTIEDDRSDSKSTVTSYQKLRSANGISALIGGSWWLNSIVKRAEKDNVLLISAETLLNDDTVLAPNYFILQGDLRQWVYALEPVIRKQQYKRGAIIRFSSGFGSTLEKAMREVFSREGREFAGAIEYSDIDLGDAANAVLELKKIHADVVYVDAQPAGLRNVLRKLRETGLAGFPVLSNSIADDLLRESASDPALLEGVTYTMRRTDDAQFRTAYQKRFGKEPQLNADLGYYALHLIHQLGREAKPIEKLKSGSVRVHDKLFVFDANNALQDLKEEVFVIRSGRALSFPSESDSAKEATGAL